MSNQVIQQSLDLIDIKLVTSGITLVAPRWDSRWRILPYTMLTSIREAPGENAGSSLLEFPDGSTEIFSPGTTVLIPRNTRHRFTNMQRPHTATWIHWDVMLSPGVDLFSFCEIPGVITGETSRRILDFCREIALCPLTDLAGVVRVKSLLYSLLSVLLEEFEFKKEYHNFQIYHHAFTPLLNYIDEQLAGRLTLEEAAKYRKCSVSKLQRDFSAAFGIPFGKFVLNRRLNQAARLLCGGDLNLAEIAGRVGFSDAFSLSKAFKKHFSLSPREYRGMSRRRGAETP